MDIDWRIIWTNSMDYQENRIITGMVSGTTWILQLPGQSHLSLDSFLKPPLFVGLVYC